MGGHDGARVGYAARVGICAKNVTGVISVRGWGRCVREDGHDEVGLFTRKSCVVVGCSACCVGNGWRRWGT